MPPPQPKTSQPERLAYDLAAAADAIGLPKRTLQDALSRGEFRAKKRCGRWMVTRAELLRWLTSDETA